MKKHWIIATGAFLLFTALCVTATAFLLGRNTTPVPTHGIDVYGTYDENDLLVEQVSLPQYGEDVVVPQISGLKNSAVEEAINAHMTQRITEILESSGEIYYADFYTYANFANVLSLGYYISGTEQYTRGCLNFDLTTGEQLRLGDLFYSDVDLLSLVRHGFYETLAQQASWGQEGPASPDENLLYRLVTDFMKNPDQGFYFTPAEVHFFQDDVSATIDFLSNAEDVAIYERYLTKESIFTREDVGHKNLFTCSLGNYESFDHIDYGYGAENLWYDVTMWNYDMYADTLPQDAVNAVAEFGQKALDESYALVEQYKQLARENPHKGYIILLKPGYDLISIEHYHAEGWHTEYAHAVETFVNGTVYEMPLELFENTYKDRILRAYRSKYITLSGGVYLSGDDTGAVVTEIAQNTLTNYKTGQVYTSLGEVFAIKESFYTTLIHARVVDELMYWYGPDRTRYEAEALATDMICTLDGAYIRVTLPQVPDLNISYRLNEFDAAYLTIFPKEES